MKTLEFNEEGRDIEAVECLKNLRSSEDGNPPKGICLRSPGTGRRFCQAVSE